MTAWIRYVLAAFVFLAYSVPAATHLYLAWIRCLLTRAPPARRRLLASRWRSWWGSRAFEAVTRMLGMRVALSHAGPPAGVMVGERPVIVVSNHQSTMDILVLQWALRQLGQKNVRWVLKAQLRHRALFMGHSCIMSECAFVRRGRSASDLAAIRDLAARADADGAGVIIFPEGTRYARYKRRKGYRNILPPKSAGFEILLGGMAEHDILSVTVNWTGRETAKTVFGLASLVGKTITVEWERIPRAFLTDDWLDREWARKDARIGRMDRTAI